MESDKIEQLLEKYFDAQTTSAEEKQLQQYFSAEVAPHLEQYKPLFGYYAFARQQQFEQAVPLKTKKRSKVAWLSVAASVAVLAGAGTFAYFQQTQPQDLGTYDSPEEAFRETQKALALLSDHVNTGVQSVQYIQTYEATKDRVFVDHH